MRPEHPKRLTETVQGSGCASKIGPGDLSRALCGISVPETPDVLVGLRTPDDAGIFRIDAETALVQTVDFFTPIVDDPYTFGRIAAANAMSDVWAMGGRPVCAMNLVCFPVKTLDFEILSETLRGGSDVLREAGAALIGGHSVEAPEFKYGLSVSGIVHPRRFLTAEGARPGDALVLSKPLGTGVISTALKAGLAAPEAVEEAVRSMSLLNRSAGELMLRFSPSACTDVTGFSLLGHAFHMVRGGKVGLTITSASVPVLPGARQAAETGLLPAGLHRNRDFYGPSIEFHPSVPEWLADILFDPQTSGGLLTALPAEEAPEFVEALRSSDCPAASIIGRFTSEHPGKIFVE